MAGYLIDWIEALHRDAREARGLLGHSPDAEKPLPTRIHGWWNTLPSADRKDRYTMDELVPLFGAPPAQMGVTLAGLGWRRGRTWTGGTYKRYWLPPD